MNAIFASTTRFKNAPKSLTLVLGFVWLGIVVTGTSLLTAYSNKPGQAGRPPTDWPAASSVSFSRQRSTLVMFIHPHCSCSRASIGELAVLMAGSQGKVDAHVFFSRPAEMTQTWVRTDLWREAARIPGVTLHQDDEVREAQLFRAETSGDTALYNTNGQLLFQGGITSARGHFGDSAGLDILNALLSQQSVHQTNTPVFGCSLFACSNNIEASKP